jgi:DNA-binding CsgD family transcriptional regulator
LLATAHACAGDAEAAAAAVAELDRLEPFPFVRPEQDLGRAWALAAAGDLARARAQLMTAVGLAAEAGYVASEAMLLHEVVRLGGAASVVDRLYELAPECEGLWIPTFAAHAAAVVAGRSKWLVDVVDQFESFGAMLLAAEVANEAAQAYQSEGNGRAAAAMRVRSEALGDACEGARTPRLTAIVMVVPLTARERDIAALASSGESSKEIADRLFLSVRTVNNHLQSVYSKLGIAGRHQLEGALGDN